jgi:hypothetical protein
MRSAFTCTHRTSLCSKLLLSCYNEILPCRYQSAAKRIAAFKADETPEYRQMYVSEDEWWFTLKTQCNKALMITWCTIYSSKFPSVVYLKFIKKNSLERLSYIHTSLKFTFSDRILFIFQRFSWQITRDYLNEYILLNCRIILFIHLMFQNL